MAERINLRDYSRKQLFITVEEDEKISSDSIKLGTLLRLADATEKMAEGFSVMLGKLEWMTNDRDYYKNETARKNEALKKSKLSNSALKGQITKLKASLAGKNEQSCLSTSPSTIQSGA